MTARPEDTVRDSGLAAELQAALDDPKRYEWGDGPWEHLGDAERDVRALLAELAACREERDKLQGRVYALETSLPDNYREALDQAEREIAACREEGVSLLQSFQVMANQCARAEALLADAERRAEKFRGALVLANKSAERRGERVRRAEAELAACREERDRAGDTARELVKDALLLKERAEHERGEILDRWHDEMELRHDQVTAAEALLADARQKALSREYDLMRENSALRRALAAEKERGDVMEHERDWEQDVVNADLSVRLEDAARERDQARDALARAEVELEGARGSAEVQRALDIVREALT